MTPTQPTQDYWLSTISDLLKVPSEKRAVCIHEILLALEFAELAGGEVHAGPHMWTDDGNASVSLIDPDTGKAQLTLKVTRP